MKSIRFFRAMIDMSLVSLCVVSLSCQPESLTGPLREDVTFTVTTVDAPTTKSPGAAPAAVPVTTSAAMPGLTGDPTPGNEYGMTVEESPLRLDRTAEAPATKAEIYPAGALAKDAKLGLVAYKYAASNATSGWTLHSNPAPLQLTLDDSGTGGKRPGVGSDKWIPSPGNRLKWPGAGFIRYFAYAPYDASGLTGSFTSGSPNLSYTVPDKVSDQKDLLVSTPASTREYAGDPGWRKIDVPVTLQHALTGIRFRLVEGLTIDKVTISGVRNKGTLNLSSSPLSWTGASGSGNYTLSNLSLGSGLVADTEYDQSGYNITEEDKTLLLMPQTVPASAKITVTVQNATDPSLSREITADIAGQEWRPGTMVTYTITRSDLKISSTINLYNPGGGNGGEPDFTYTVLPASRTIWTGESFTLSASSPATPAPTYTFSVDNTVVGPSSGSLTLAGTTASTTVTANTTTPGQAVVTVKAKRGSIEKTDKTCAVTVYKLTDLEITNAGTSTTSGNTRSYTLTIAVGDPLTPRVMYNDGTGSDKEWTGGTVTWKIADGQPTDVVSVAGGVVTARKAGTTTVEGTITKGSVTRTVSCTVTVI